MNPDDNDEEESEYGHVEPADIAEKGYICHTMHYNSQA